MSYAVGLFDLLVDPACTTLGGCQAMVMPTAGPMPSFGPMI